MCETLDFLLLVTITIGHLFLRVNVFSCISAAKRIETVSANAWRQNVIQSLPICQPHFLACKMQASYWGFIPTHCTGLHCPIY